MVTVRDEREEAEIMKYVGVHDVNMGKGRVRKSFATIDEVVEMPDLIEVQKNSYERFLKEDLREVMHEQGLTEGFDVGLEMSGNAAAFHQLISVMRSGGKVSLLGLGDGPISVDMNQIITNGLTLQGIYGRKMDNWHQMSYMGQCGLDLTPVITHRFHYTDFQKGFDAMMSGKSGKVVLDWTK